MDTEPKDIFVTEGAELLDTAEESLLNLESDFSDKESLNNLFRVMHTLKGSAGIVGFEYVESFTHHFENFLDKLRNDEITLTSDIVSLLLKTTDYIGSIVQHIDDTGDDSDDAIVAQGDAILEELNSIYDIVPASKNDSKNTSESVDDSNKEEDVDDSLRVITDYWHISLRFKEDFFLTGMDPSSFINYLRNLGSIVSITLVMDNLPDFNELDPEKCYLGFEIDFDTEFERQAIIDVFEFVLDDCDISVIPPKSKIEEYINLINELPENKERLGEILVEGGTLTENELDIVLNKQQEGFGEKKQKLGEMLVEDKKVSPQVVDAALQKQKKVKEKKSKESRSLRVDAEKLDYVINIVGELVTTTSGILQKSKVLNDSQLEEFSSNLYRLVNDLRDTSMELRMVPIGESFNRFRRLVRDLSKDSGKEIDLEIKGGETELDKTFIEKISDPLVHLIRNSIDHGIENIEKRKQKGKNPKGKITLNAYNDAGSIVIEITDDGKGLDKDAIGQKAVEKGMISSYQGMSDSEVYKLIFEPGFSTAAQITNISGRGVGMDVVRRNIEDLRGSVSIDTELGKYTTIKVRLPLTLAIIDGFLVEVNEQKYVIPLDMVVECVEFDEKKLKSDERNYITLRDKILPFIRMNEIFHEEESGQRYENIVIVNYGEQSIGLVVDEIHGEVQAVIKSLGNMYRDAEFFSGATILGDGSVALILDVQKLVKVYEKTEKEYVK